MLRRSQCRLLGTTFGATIVPPIANEPCLSFAPGTEARKNLADACKKVRSEVHTVPVVIGGKRLYPGNPVKVPIPSANKKTFVKYHEATEEMMQEAIQCSLEAHKEWSRVPFQDRAAIMLRAANLLAKSHWRWDIEAATVVGQSKNPWQAEIDSVTEACDFLRFHTKFAAEMYNQQPISPPGTNIWNMTEYRPLEGFVTAISPFNFTAIGTNLAATPALMGNTVLWKPSPGAIYANYRSLCLLEEAGLPAGVINFVPCGINAIEKTIRHKELAGVAFTGSTKTFQAIWQNVGNHIGSYRNFPRVSGETGGKNFHLVHPSAHIPTVVACTVRAAFEYQGQKCSACSRLFVPKSKWGEIKAGLLEVTSQLKQGQPDDFSSFLCAVIDKAAYEKNVRYIEIAKREGCNFIAGGKYSCEEGWFIEPSICVAPNLNATTLREEIFGPVLTVYVYDDSSASSWKDICQTIDKGAAYGLTGSIFSLDRAATRQAQDLLRYTSGMLYINDKSTGAVVGQQPFGGARQSGTNDKPGGFAFVEKWVTQRTIKEAFDYLPQVSYPHQLPDVIEARSTSKKPVKNPFL